MIPWLMIGFLWMPDIALATQAHGDPEGVYVHQMSHIFFALSMGLLIYWIRTRELHQEEGWRYMQYSAVFFILWTLDAFIVHLLDEQYRIVAIRRITHWRMELTTPPGVEWAARVYYLVKLDHLLCVPGLFLLYLALSRLARRASGSLNGKQAP